MTYLETQLGPQNFTIGGPGPPGSPPGSAPEYPMWKKYYPQIETLLLGKDLSNSTYLMISPNFGKSRFPTLQLLKNFRML